MFCKILSTMLFSVFTIFSYANFSACDLNHEADLSHDHSKDYIYDCDGTPLFVKVYIEEAALISHFKHETRILQKFLQLDEFGSFLPMPIMKKKKKDKDDDQDEEKYWICPYCDTKNPESAQFCTKPGCVLHRKGGRNW